MLRVAKVIPSFTSMALYLQAKVVQIASVAECKYDFASYLLCNHSNA